MSASPEDSYWSVPYERLELETLQTEIKRRELTEEMPRRRLGSAAKLRAAWAKILRDHDDRTGEREIRYICRAWCHLGEGRAGAIWECVGGMRMFLADEKPGRECVTPYTEALITDGDRKRMRLAEDEQWGPCVQVGA